MIFSGALAFSSAFTGPAGGPKDFDILVDLTTPFFYNPALGNLLLDVRNFSGEPTPPSTFFDAVSGLPYAGRIFAFDVGATAGTPFTEALVIRFGFTLEVALEVAIDIKPGSDPNSINCRHNGVIPVAILTTSDFDATTVDPSTVGFGPAAAMRTHRRAHIQDVDGDGDLDMVLHFRQRNTGIQCGDVEACLTGQSIDGTPIEGCDAIRTLGG